MSLKTEWVWCAVSGGKGWKALLSADLAKEHGTALAEFWVRVRAQENRLGLLKHFADRVVARLQPYKAIRRGRAKTTSGGTCWACRAGGKRLVTHHIIQVQHGGRNTKRNVVRVCHSCHMEIHPWMKGKATAKTKQEDIAIPAAYVPPVFDDRPRLVKT